MSNHRLTIAVMATAHLRYPLDPKKIYAPVRLAAELATALAKRGHRVFYFGPSGTRVPGVIVPKTKLPALMQLPTALGKKIFHTDPLLPKENEKLQYLWDQYLLAEIILLRKKEKIDIVHVHPIDRILPFAKMLPEVQFVSTLHDPISSWRAETYRLYDAPNMHIVSISNAQRKPAQNLNYADTIYNGVHLRDYPFDKNGGDNALFVGRLMPVKGTDLAINAALSANLPITVAGTPGDADFFSHTLQPLFKNKNVRYAGTIPFHQTAKLYGKARVLLCPIRWDEAFGLTFIEAMACGTPVIAFRRGSAPEVIKNGKTGFVVDTLPEMIRAIKKIDTINRADCRAWVEEKFSFEKMVDGYEDIFLRITASNNAKNIYAHGKI